jgi:hypothetical protein
VSHQKPVDLLRPICSKEGLNPKMSITSVFAFFFFVFSFVMYIFFQKNVLVTMLLTSIVLQIAGLQPVEWGTASSTCKCSKPSDYVSGLD